MHLQRERADLHTRGLPRLPRHRASIADSSAGLFDLKIAVQLTSGFHLWISYFSDVARTLMAR
jgi:hypothetical protein